MRPRSVSRELRRVSSACRRSRRAECWRRSKACPWAGRWRIWRRLRVAPRSRCSRPFSLRWRTRSTPTVRRHSSRASSPSPPKTAQS
uniref:Uncharacterized protein n=1 Tax=Toxoplasma gondii (strain ATCC 50861 / VEG) TaxID=432359 RepID=A0A0F7V542_TOXGV|nr:TPA: hypothetical protein BN1205_098610 [Toxoplasma gondii VEG]